MPKSLFALSLLLVFYSCHQKSYHHVDWHNDRSFFLTGKNIAFDNCHNSEICQRTFLEGSYFFSIWRPTGRVYTGPPWHLSQKQAAVLNSHTPFQYVKKAVTELQSLKIPISNVPGQLLQRQPAIFLGLEGSQLLENRFAPGPSRPYQIELESMVTWLAQNKFSYVGLSHSTPNVFTGNQKQKKGLSTLGRKLVKMLLEKKLLIDLSHSSAQTAIDLYQMTRGKYPLFYSHAAAYTLCKHERNLKDDLLDLVKKSRGLVAVIYYPRYLSCKNEATISDIVRHILYLVERLGIDHVALGSDFDSYINLPAGMRSPLDVPRLKPLLLERGLSNEDIKKIFYLNSYRLLNRARSFSVPQQY